ncbi:MAG: FHA domain-containing protein [Actinomycetota bacterium]|nr:FHA domain-containing protein [Actinomycetota bacterium]
MPPLAAAVSPFVLSVLKYAFLALVYFFVFRALRTVAVDVAGRRSRAPDTRPSRPVARGATPTRAGKGKAPTSVVVRDEAGKKLDSVPLAGAVQIGRAEACHVRIEDRYASQFHARLYSKNGAWYVEDLGSTNGTYLNQQRVSGSAQVQAGDHIRIGKTTLELKR